MPISAVGLPIRLAGPTAPTTVVAGAVIYTAPNDGRIVIRSVILSNTSTTTTNVSIILGINGVAAANQFVPTLVVTGNAAPIVIVGDIVLNPGDTINATQGSASTVTVIISGEAYPV